MLSFFSVEWTKIKSVSSKSRRKSVNWKLCLKFAKCIENMSWFKIRNVICAVSKYVIQYEEKFSALSLKQIYYMNTRFWFLQWVCRINSLKFRDCANEKLNEFWNIAAFNLACENSRWRVKWQWQQTNLLLFIWFYAVKHPKVFLNWELMLNYAGQLS